MKTSQPVTESYTGLQRAALIVGVVALVLSLAGAVMGGWSRFFQSYLFSFNFWIGLSLGSLALLLLHHLSGARWGLSFRRVSEAAALTLPLMVLLFIPLLLALPTLYPWAQPGIVAASEVLQHKSAYLNVPFFIIRAVIYFAVWILLALAASRSRSNRTGEPAVREHRQGFGAFGLILYGLTVTFAAVDWLMSLQPLWSSTIYGLIVMLGQLLTALAFAIMLLNLLPGLSLGRRWNYLETPIPFRDLGAMLLTLVMGWTYLAFFQYLIIWAGNIPREITWYLDRSQGGWQIVAAIGAILLFGLPFLALISIRVRHNLRLLGVLGAVILAAGLLNMYWQVIPAFSPGAFSLHWLDLVVPLAMGGIWLAGFFFALARRPGLALPEREELRLTDQHEKAIP